MRTLIRAGVRLDLWVAGLTVVAGLLSIILILQVTYYPYSVHRSWIFHYFLREQDIAGSLLVIAVALGCAIERGNAPLGVVEWLAERYWIAVAAALVAMVAAVFLVAKNHALAGDEHLALFQSRVFAAGRLTGRFPPELLYRLIPSWYQWHWLIASETTGEVVSLYWPGFALLLVPFQWLGIPWLCNPLLAALSVILMAKLAARLSDDRRAAGWAVLLALGSPGLMGMALSYFSMTAHLFLNLLYVWLLLQRTPHRLAAAGLVGSFALVQSNPVPHLLFALPWIVSVARSPLGRRNLAVLLAGYAPLTLVLGLGWWLFLRHLQGSVPMALYPADSDLTHRIGNLIWYLFLEFRNVFGASDAALINRLLEQARLWSWAVPGLVILALAGWWLARDVREARLLGYSLVTTVLGYLPVVFDQGSGWGARYVHPAWGAIPVLAALALVRIGHSDGERLAAFTARAGVYSLVFANALRLLQIHLFMEDQLSLRPPFEKGVRQIVFIVPNPGEYAQDFLQNDPFLRDPVIFMMSRGRAADATLITQRYPGARLTYDGSNGQVWRLE